MVDLVRRGLMLLLLGLVGPFLVDPAVSRSADFVQGEVIVTFRGDAPRPASLETLPGIETSEAVGAMDNVKLLNLDSGETVAGSIRRLEARSDVLYAQPNWIYRIKNSPRQRRLNRILSTVPNDPMFGQLWGLRNLGQNVYESPEVTLFGFRAIDSGAWRAWRFRTGGRGAVGVVDSGIARDHPDLNRNLNRPLSRNFAPAYEGGPVDPNAWDDMHGHGTHVAGTIGAVGNNGIGVVGVNWRTRLVALRVCDADGACESAAMAAAIDYAGRRGIPVLNMSIGSEPGDPYPANRVVIDAIRRYPRMLFVTAAGNETNNNDRNPEWPCSAQVPNMICVAAIDPRGGLAYFSNWGRRTVDLGAPGQFITSTWVNKVFPLDDVFFRDGIVGWHSDGWQETEFDESPVLSFQGPAAESWVGPVRSFDLRGMRYCRVTTAMSGTLAGSQRVTVQYRVDGGVWTDSPDSIGAGALSDEDEDLSFSLPDAGGNAGVEIRILYRSGGTASPEPIIRLSFADLACVNRMPPGGVYRQLEGTSMASPHVAGVATLARSVFPRLRGVGLKRVLMLTARRTDSLRGKTVSGARVDAARAARMARNLRIRARR